MNNNRIGSIIQAVSTAVSRGFPPLLAIARRGAPTLHPAFNGRHVAQYHPPSSASRGSLIDQLLSSRLSDDFYSVTSERTQWATPRSVLSSGNGFSLADTLPSGSEERAMEPTTGSLDRWSLRSRDAKVPASGAQGTPGGCKVIRGQELSSGVETADTEQASPFSGTPSLSLELPAVSEQIPISRRGRNEEGSARVTRPLPEIPRLKLNSLEKGLVQAYCQDISTLKEHLLEKEAVRRFLSRHPIARRELVNAPCLSRLDRKVLKDLQGVILHRFEPAGEVCIETTPSGQQTRLPRSALIYPIELNDFTEKVLRALEKLEGSSKLRGSETGGLHQGGFETSMWAKLRRFSKEREGFPEGLFINQRGDQPVTHRGGAAWTQRRSDEKNLSEAKEVLLLFRGIARKENGQLEEGFWEHPLRVLQEDGSLSSLASEQSVSLPRKLWMHYQLLQEARRPDLFPHLPKGVQEKLKGEVCLTALGDAVVMVDPTQGEKRVLSPALVEELAHQILVLCLNHQELIFKTERMQLGTYGSPPTVKQRLPNGSLRPATKSELIHMLDLARPDFRRATLASKQKLSYQTLVALMNKQAFAAVQKNPSRPDEPKVAQIAPPPIQGRLLRSNFPGADPTWHAPIQAMQGAGRPSRVVQFNPASSSGDALNHLPWGQRGGVAPVQPYRLPHRGEGAVRRVIRDPRLQYAELQPTQAS